MRRLTGPIKTPPPPHAWFTRMPFTVEVPVLIAMQRFPVAVHTPQGHVGSIAGPGFQPCRRGFARTMTTRRLHGLAGQAAVLLVAVAEKHGSARKCPHKQRQTNRRPSTSETAGSTLRSRNGLASQTCPFLPGVFGRDGQYCTGRQRVVVEGKVIVRVSRAVKR